MAKKYKNKTTINRVRKSKNFHKRSISMDIFKNKELGFIEIGILTWLLSNGKNYIINKLYIMKRSQVPDEKFKKAWKKLEDLGYIQKIPIQGGCEWVINELPKTYAD